ncbi:MAG TPA: sugar phosphate nucleotidyltransferase [Candidatus Paceibacterota bacterium]|nr:sugar phosphate nucleotidyltransferase [Candidatus Paceibacterota bacterium]
MAPITKLVLPVAGLGKRLRPLTNRKPKALVHLADEPLLSYMLHEASASGITEVSIVASPQHERHFRRYIKNYAKGFPTIKNIHLRIQRRPLGDGHAVLQAHDLLGNDAVAVRFPDDLVLARKPILKSLMDFYSTHRAPVLLLERVPKRFVSRYGIAGAVAVRNRSVAKAGRRHLIKMLVEKPPIYEAPSNLAIVGGYIITPRMLRGLARKFRTLKNYGNDALRLIVAFQSELAAGRKVYGLEFSGRRLDCGTLEGFYRADKIVREYKLKNEKNI